MNDYEWEYLRQDQPRREILGNFIDPHIGGMKGVFDFQCGFAPLLAGYSHLGYYGVDSNKEITPKRNGFWVADTKDFDEDLDIDIFFYLGIYGDIQSGKDAVRLIHKYNPKLVVLERTFRVKRKPIYAHVSNYLHEMGMESVATIVYDSKMDINNIRKVSIYKEV